MFKKGSRRARPCTSPHPTITSIQSSKHLHSFSPTPPQNPKMMSKLFAIATIIGAVVAKKATPTPTPTPSPSTSASMAPAADLTAFLGDGTTVSASGDAAVGVAANKDAGAAAGKLDGAGDVIAAAGPGLATALAADASPAL